MRILAQAEQGGSRLFSGDPGEVGRNAMDGSHLDPNWVLPIAGAFAVVFSLLSLVKLVQTHRRQPHSLWVFLCLCRQVGLNWADRLLLYRIARATSLPSPIALMLSPGTLRKHTAAFSQSMGRTQAAAVKLRVASIRRHLFAAVA